MLRELRLRLTRWLLATCKVPADKPDGAGAGPLHYAAAMGDDPTALWLLSVGASPSRANDDGNTPLHYACQAGSLSLAEALLDAGAGVSARNADGDTPFLLACAMGDAGAVRLLISL